MGISRFELDAEARDKRKVAALEKLAAVMERIADALQGREAARQARPPAPKLT